MGKRRGNYIGGSTMLSASGNGFSTDPDFPARKKKKRPQVRPEDRAYAPPKMSAAEQAEYDRLRKQMTEPKFVLLKRSRIKKP